jgi:hypothetical protein
MFTELIKSNTSHLSGFSTADNKFVLIVRQAQMVSTGDNEI